MNYNKADFQNHISTLQVSGFEFRGAVQALLFARRRPDRTETITVSYKDYAPHGFYISGASADISFDEVESPLNRLLANYGIDQQYGDTTIQETFQKLPDIDYGVFDTQLISRETFDLVAEQVRKIVRIGALPFFEQYRDLTAVSEGLRTMSEDEISNFVSGIVGIKVPLIKKIAHSPDYREELKRRLEFYSVEVFKYPQYFKNHEKVFRALFSDDIKCL